MSHRHEDPGADQAGRDADWVAGLLDTEARRYSPDGRRIRAAMHEQMGGSRHRASPRIRVSRIRAGIATATLVAVAAAVVATVETRPPSPGSSPAAATSKAPPASRTPVAGSSTPAGGRSTQGTAGDRAVPASIAPTPPPSSAPPSAEAGAKLVSATGTSDLGSFPYWLQEELSVRLREPVNEFQLTVKVARTPGVASTGYWMTYNPPTIFDVAVTDQASTVTYTFTLKPGHTLPAGSPTFAVQFNHATSHSPAADSYALSVVSDEQNATIRGQAVGGF